MSRFMSRFMSRLMMHSKLSQSAAFFCALVALSGLLAAPDIRAEERVVVPLNDFLITHKDDVKSFKLRGQIRKMRGEYDSDRYQLAYIGLLAKSRRNNGHAWITVDQFDGESQRIEGTEDQFESDNHETYHRLRLAVPEPKDFSGHWTLNFKGAVKIKRIIIGLNDCGEGECLFQHEVTRRVIPLEDSEVRVPSSNKVIDLRKLVERYDGGVSLRDARLLKVEMLTKVYEKSGAIVRLDLEGQRGIQTEINGGRKNYRSRDPDSYTRIVLEPRDSSGARGDWELLLRRGTFRIREIAVTTIDKAFWRSSGKALPPAGQEEIDEVIDDDDDKKDKKTTKANKCSGKSCKSGRSVVARAGGALSCYASGDGRQIDRRDGAKMSFVKGCADGKCVKTTEMCYESRTCKCSNGEGRCKDRGSCGGGVGCKYGYVSLKFHCPSGIFDG